MEQNVLKNNNGHSKFHFVGPLNSETNCLWIGVHGIKDSPKSILKLSSTLNTCDKAVFVYDDLRKRLTVTSKHFSDEFIRLSDSYEKVFIDAHSMGARIVLYGLFQMKQIDTLIELNLMAPNLIGHRSADFAKFSFWPLTKIAGVRPGKDLGRNSKFQKILNNIKLPSNIETHIWTGENDSIIDSGADLFSEIVENLNATWTIIDNAAHAAIIEMVYTELFQRRNTI